MKYKYRISARTSMKGRTPVGEKGYNLMELAEIDAIKLSKKYPLGVDIELLWVDPSTKDVKVSMRLGPFTRENG